MDLAEAPRIGVESLLVLASFIEKLDLAAALVAKERTSEPLDQEGPRAEAKAARARSSRRSNTRTPTVAANHETATRRSHRRSAAAGPRPDSKGGEER
jgi:hypothetical protein